jgi:hypothetical protein
LSQHKFFFNFLIFFETKGMVVFFFYQMKYFTSQKGKVQHMVVF